MLNIEIIIGLLLVVAIGAVVAQRLAIPYPILLVLGGLVLGFIPNLPRVEIDPELIFLVFLPPLITSAAWYIPWQEFRTVFVSVFLLSTGLVLATTSIVAVVAHTIISGIPWSAAFVLGAVVSPTDAVAATAIAKALSVPRRIVILLEGESLVNDATGLVTYRFAQAAVVTGVFSFWKASAWFVVVALGGVIVGLAVGWLVTWIHRRLDESTIEVTFTILMSYASYLLAEQLGLSGVLAAMTLGLYHRWQSPEMLSPRTRIQTIAVWEFIVFILNGLIFVLIGLQLPIILDHLSGESITTLIWFGTLISATVLGVRLVWVFPGTYLARLLSRRLRESAPYPSWQQILIVGWAGMRGGISLAAALTIPLSTNNGTPFPERNLIIFLTFCVIFVTLVLQGLFLPTLIKWLKVVDDDSGIKREEMEARLQAAKAAMARIEELTNQDTNLASDQMIEWLRIQYKERICQYDTYCQAMNDGSYKQLAAFQSLQHEVLAAERSMVIKLRNQGIISDDVLHRIERDFDLESALLGSND
ncbi:Na+/H+ antiporter [Nostoc sp.]|uniref:Na+/H+ antiporter n=1 Tax=Nostoc sp. TaxID=1180 RepID=UPI002FF71E4D